jgi:hypothetical protein
MDLKGSGRDILEIFAGISKTENSSTIEDRPTHRI